MSVETITGPRPMWSREQLDNALAAMRLRDSHPKNRPVEYDRALVAHKLADMGIIDASTDYYSGEQVLACRANPDMFIPIRENADNTKEAKRACMPCPIRAACLQEALDNGIEWGVWGGLNARERRALKRRGSIKQRRPTE